ncbi:TPA: hypothetical protein JBI12_13995 [Legionella pneumophila]|nr:hypothetical protein [Legionella pneumophila]
MFTKDEKRPAPIEYLGGVMDEETRPLLQRYIQGLQDGEGVLVVFRLLEGTNPNVLLESDIVSISGHNWNYIAGQNAEGEMQKLVDRLSEHAGELRVANAFFSQGSAKIKAFDDHKVCFGIIGKNEGEIKSIKGIVHQQLNMGLNGDLLLHEGDIIMQALVENGVFHEGHRQRPIQVKTYGAGGSSSSHVNPGDMAISDGVIDIRTHVDPLCLVEYLEKYCSDFKLSNPNVRTKELEEFLSMIQHIREQAMDPDYTGISMVHDVAELARRASLYTGQKSTEIIGQMDPQLKRYYGEITFATSNSGIAVAHRMDTRADGTKYTGDSGQAELVKALQSFLGKMSRVNHEEFEKEMNALLERQREVDRKIRAVRDERDLILKDKLDTNAQQQHRRLLTNSSDIEQESEKLVPVLIKSGHDEEISELCEEKIIQLRKSKIVLLQLDEQLLESMSSLSPSTEERLKHLHDELSCVTERI